MALGSQLSEANCAFCKPEVVRPATICESDYFILKEPLGAVAEGHVLLITKTHYRCLGDAPKEVLDDFLSFKAQIQSVLGTIYSCQIFAYEYGKWGQSVPHAHIHLLPAKTDRFELESLIRFARLHVPFLSGFHAKKEMIEPGGFKCLPIEYSSLGGIYRQFGCYVAIEERSELFLCDVSHLNGEQANPHLNHREFFAVYKGLVDVRDWSKMTSEQLEDDKARRKATRTKIISALRVEATSSK